MDRYLAEVKRDSMGLRGQLTAEHKQVRKELGLSQLNNYRIWTDHQLRASITQMRLKQRCRAAIQKGEEQDAKERKAKEDFAR